MITIEPYSKEELSHLPTINDQISNTYGGELEQHSSSVLSANIFTGPRLDIPDKIERTEKFSKLGVIDLNYGVLNPLLGGQGQVWGKALGIKPAVVMQIAKGELLYRISTKELVPPIKVPQITDEYAIGGKALLSMLDERIKTNGIEIDLKKAIAKKFLYSTLKQDGLDVADIVRELYENGPEEDHIFGKYYFPFSLFMLSKEQVVKHSKGIEFRNEQLDSELLNDLSRKVLDDSSSSKSVETDNYDDADEYYIDDSAEEDEEWRDYLDKQQDAPINSMASIIAGLGVTFGSEDAPDNTMESSEEPSIGDIGVDVDSITFTQRKPKKDLSAQVSQYEDMTVLEVLTTPAGIKRLKSTIMFKLPVLPYGYRTTFTGKNSTYTVLYDHIFSKERNELPYLKAFPEEFCMMYKRIYNMIRCLFFGDSVVERALSLKNHKPLITALSGKKGRIRLYTEGGRFDYTGRSVIVSSPDMPIDTVGVPLEIAAKIFLPRLAKKFLKDLEYKQSTGKITTDPNRNLHKTINDNYSKYLEWVHYNARHIEKSLYAYIGRQPSLHYLSMQPYKVRIIEDDTLVLSPTIVEPFNADFDGDQMHISAVLTDEAVEEIKTNELLSQQPKRKPNGEIGSKPRLEMIYGLYIALNAGNTPSQNSYSIEDIHTKLKANGADNKADANPAIMNALSLSLINAEDLVNGAPASLQALNYILNQAKSGALSSEEVNKYFKDKDAGKGLKEKEVNTKAIINTFASKPTDLIVDCYSNLVRLTYGIAKRHLINASITQTFPEFRDYISEEVEKFNQRMYEKKKAVDLGLMSVSAYDRAFGSEWSKIQKKIDEELMNVLPLDNGYRIMKETGAKGSKDTIRQIYGVKGQIEQVLDRPFGCIIENSYANKLTGMQHFCTAYGARKGISDKVLATSKPGYLARKLNHAGATIKISKTIDCGTKSGLDYNILDIAPLLDEVDQRLSWYFWTQEEYDNAKLSQCYRVTYSTCKEKMSELLVGRNCIVDGRTRFVADIKSALSVLDEVWGKDFPVLAKPIVNGVIEYKPIIVRSPITCECPCCQTCYGFDWTLNKQIPEVGKKIGFIAAQAISEPGTQMTMKNFQRAGVVSSANLTSAFDIIEAYFDLRGRTHSSKIPYDYVSPVDGVVDTIASVGYNRLIIKPIKNIEECAEDIAKGDLSTAKLGSNCVLSHIFIDNTIELKKVVHRGEPVQMFCGNIDIKQSLTSWSCLHAAKYLTLRLTQIYNKSSVKSIYIETILAGMLLGRVLKEVTIKVDGNKITYPAGSTISRSLLSYATSDISDIEIQWFLVGIKQLPKYKPDSMESLIMESLSTYLPRAAVIQPYDAGLNPISTLLMGDERFGGE